MRNMKSKEQSVKFHGPSERSCTYNGGHAARLKIMSDSRFLILSRRKFRIRKKRFLEIFTPTYTGLSLRSLNRWPSPSKSKPASSHDKHEAENNLPKLSPKPDSRTKVIPKSAPNLRSLQEPPEGLDHFTTPIGLCIRKLFKKFTIPEIAYKHSFHLSCYEESGRYFKTEGRCRYRCPNMHYWESNNTECYFDLKAKKICHWERVPCPTCQVSMVPRFDYIECIYMIEDAVQQLDTWEDEKYSVQNEVSSGEFEINDNEATVASKTSAVLGSSTKQTTRKKRKP